jgi:hypothetical protein
MSRRLNNTNQGLTHILDSIQKNYDFGYCAVESTETRIFSIVNTTTGILKFTIKSAENSPFKLSHLSGVLQVKGKQDVTISYTPKE